MEGEELLAIASDLEKRHETFERDNAPIIRRLAESADEIGGGWSGSNLGYHANVYYAGLRRPPPGAHFSSEWGLRDDLISLGSRGDWQEYSSDQVQTAIYRLAGNPDLTAARSESNAIRSEVGKARSAMASALTLVLAEQDDTFLRNLLGRIEKERLPSVSDFSNAMLPSGKFITRDGIAMGQGLRLAPHQAIMAEATALHAPSAYAAQLADIARQAGSHLLRRRRRLQKEKLVGTNVFIGHGRSPAWRELKDFVKDRVGLPYDEFNRVPVAGVTNIARLSEMLDAAAIAFLILTAEDERVDGTMQARMNVIHEVGLFQGRLGFGRALVVLEEGCSEFTNIQGLGQIRFPNGRISAAFEEIRQVLEREGLIEA